MARLTEADRTAFRELTARGWVQSPAEQSPAIVEQTTAGRERYCRWATFAARFYRGSKPVRFVGSHWKL
ncbi:MAG: hypothetical protein LJE69_03455 [Thiohalocapsa sp.]|jgi:hypothetical protein|uniref:hypothetical protein n=1 Tax=Thiohalocapsa sp. TaxID=2497641 RepID=UPI0025FF21F4|nr:hypothetical protein [Thiohalocapsa sp.]MCG6940291.1 hypothetical protein [Thiohalocapsa sp.]